MTLRWLLHKASQLLSSITANHMTSRQSTSKPLCTLLFPAQSGRIYHYSKRARNYCGFVSVVYGAYQLQVLQQTLELECTIFLEQMVLHSPLWTISPVMSSQLLAKVLHTFQRTGYLNCTVSDLTWRFFLKMAGEMSHHDVLDAVANGISVILCEHSNTERGFLSELRDMLASHLCSKVNIIVSEKDRDPLQVA